jgi:aryl-alcohol dehydrogenase-like predicted oxidoreductase
MRRKKLGNSDLSVSALGFGCSHLSGGYGRRDDPASKATIQKAAALGVNFFDTSDAYGSGQSEELLADAETIRRAHAVHPLTAVQAEYSLWTRDIERAVLPACTELDIGFVGYAPLGRGFLSGAFKSAEDFGDHDRRPNFPRFKGENLEKNLALLQPLEAMAAEKGVLPAQVALAWVLAQGDRVTPIPGTMKIAHLESNVAALDVVLNEGDVAALEEVFKPGAAAGNRYPDHRMHLVAS